MHAGTFRESKGEISLPEFPANVLEEVIKYLCFKVRFVALDVLLLGLCSSRVRLVVRGRVCRACVFARVRVVACGCVQLHVWLRVVACVVACGMMVAQRAGVSVVIACLCDGLPQAIYTGSRTVLPEFEVNPVLAMEILNAANFLDC
jgi:hypothetical protein